MGVNKPLNNYTVESVENLFRNIHEIKESCYRKRDSNYKALATDFELFWNTLELTDKQRKIVKLCWIDNCATREAAALIGINQTGIMKHIGRVRVKIQRLLIEMEETK